MPQYNDDLFLGSAPTSMGLINTATEGTVAGSVTSTVMTVTQVLSGDPLFVGQYINGAGITANSYISSFGTGVGGVGTYNLNVSSSATGAITIFASGNNVLGDPSPASVGVGPVGRVYVWDAIPQALVANCVAASQTPAAAGNLTLTAGTSVRSVIRADGTSVLQLDNPRALSVTTGTGTPTARAFTISGYDYYGQPMSEVITSSAVASTAVNGKKAFYQVSSIAVAGGTVVAITVGTTDIIGIPLRTPDAGYVLSVGWNNTLARDAGTFVRADTATATTTTGDVRGTYVPSSATDGMKRLVMSIGLSAIAAGPNATRIGALGVTQA